MPSCPAAAPGTPTAFSASDRQSKSPIAPSPASCADCREVCVALRRRQNARCLAIGFAQMPVGGTRYQTITTVALLHPCQQIGKCLGGLVQIVAQRCRMTKMRWFAGNHHHDQTAINALASSFQCTSPNSPARHNQSVGKRASMFGDIDIIGIEMRKRMKQEDGRSVTPNGSSTCSAPKPSLARA